jgi:heat shock protein HslJ
VADNQQLIKRDASRGFTASIEFTGAKAEGRIGGCNIISYDYTVQGSKINVRSLSTTAMACSDEVMKQERELNEAFEKSESFQLDGDNLEINYDNGKIIRLKRIK